MQNRFDSAAQNGGLARVLHGRARDYPVLVTKAAARSPSEIAGTVVFLASDKAADMVGSELMIDGGMSNP